MLRGVTCQGGGRTRPFREPLNASRLPGTRTVPHRDPQLSTSAPIYTAMAFTQELRGRYARKHSRSIPQCLEAHLGHRRARPDISCLHAERKEAGYCRSGQFLPCFRYRIG